MKHLLLAGLLLSSTFAWGAQSITVTVSYDKFPFRVVSTPSGINCPGTCQSKFQRTDVIVLTAVPEFEWPSELNGYFFADWDGACVDDSETCTISGKGNYSVSVTIPELAISSILSPSPVLTPADERWPFQRFYDPSVEQPDLENSLIDDYLTGERWMKNADCIQSRYDWLDNGTLTPDPDYPGDGAVDWPTALAFVEGVNSRIYTQCTSEIGADECLDSGGIWEIPSKDELESLVDERFIGPMISNRLGDAQAVEGNPFSNIASGYYWTSTVKYEVPEPLSPDPPTVLGHWSVSIHDGTLSFGSESGGVAGDFNHVWLVCKPANP